MTRSLVDKGRQALTRPKVVTESRTDAAVVTSWLNTRASRSDNTRQRYEREARYLMQFLETHGLGLADVTIDAIHAYEAGLARGLPGRQPQSTRARDGIFTVLSSLFNHAQAIGNARINPITMRARAAPDGDTYTVRALGQSQLDAITDYLHTLDSKAARTHRLRFVLSWGLIQVPRISEMIGSRMQDIYLAREGSQRVWYWRMHRKGGRPADVPVLSEAIEQMRIYRLSLGLSEYPRTDQDDGYLVWPLNGRSERPLHRGTVSDELSAFFKAAADRMDDSVMADHLRQATTHWLRHSGATHLLDAGVSVRYVSRLLDHSSINVTTRFYDHADRSKWREALESAQKPLRGGNRGSN